MSTPQHMTRLSSCPAFRAFAPLRACAMSSLRILVRACVRCPPAERVLPLQQRKSAPVLLREALELGDALGLSHLERREGGILERPLPRAHRPA
eukprot:6199883-Pleurochrysis_carterae.AAC.3